MATRAHAEPVGIDIVLIKNQPTRQVCIFKARHIFNMKRRTECVVVCSLISKPATVLIDHDGVRQRTLTIHQHFSLWVCRERHYTCWDPPCFTHVA